MGPTNKRSLKELLTNAAQILDVVRQEWGAENCWSEWDQSVRSELSRHLQMLYDTDKTITGECPYCSGGEPAHG